MPRAKLSLLSVSEILERDKRALLGGKFYVGVTRCREKAITLGASQRGYSVEERRARELGIPVFRRSSGGTGLLHLEGDIFWSIVLPRDPRWIGRDFLRSYSRFGAGWVEFLRRRGVSASWIKAAHGFPSYCLFSGRGEVLVVREKIIGGASQHLTAQALLHHGAVATTTSPMTIEKIFGLPQELSKAHLTALLDEGIGLEGSDLEELVECLKMGLGVRHFILR